MGFKALGKVVVTTAGTPVQSYASSPSDATKPIQRGLVVLVQYPTNKTDGSANTGKLYIGDRTLNKTTFLGVAGSLDPGDPFTIPGYGAYVDLENVWFDADTSGAEVFVSVVG
jgi:hypothetical protein